MAKSLTWVFLNGANRELLGALQSLTHKGW